MQSLQDHFLIAMPAMADPNFNETVTYVCKHDAEGAFGIVINSAERPVARRNARSARHRAQDRSVAERPVMHGGPVEPERGFVLHRSDTPFEATLAVGAGDQADVLARHSRGASRAATGRIPSLVALGYAGWGRGQLEAELGSNTWLTVPANPAIIFDTPFEQRWTAALGLPGVDIRRITQYAGHA